MNNTKTNRTTILVIILMIMTVFSFLAPAQVLAVSVATEVTLIKDDDLLLLTPVGTIEHNDHVRIRSEIMNNATYSTLHFTYPMQGRTWGVEARQIWTPEHDWTTAFSLPSMALWENLSELQQETIYLILQFGYGNFYGVGGAATNDDSIIVTQVAIWEVVNGLWTLETPWNGWASRNDSTSNLWHWNERLIRTTGVASGMNQTIFNTFDQAWHNHTVPIGNQNRVNRYNRLRLDINDFGCLQILPQFAHMTPLIAEEESNIHRLVWNTIRNRYEVTLSDSAPMGGNQVLNRYLNLVTGAQSIPFSDGLSVERTGANAIRLYATSTTHPVAGRHTASADFLQLRHPVAIPVTRLLDTIAGNFSRMTSAFITVEVTPRPTAVQVLKLSSTTGLPLPDVVFELQEQNPNTLDWNQSTTQQFTTDEQGKVLIENLHPGQTYRIRQISVPAPYIPGLTWYEFQPISNQTTNLRFYSTPSVSNDVDNDFYDNTPEDNFNPEPDYEVEEEMEVEVEIKHPSNASSEEEPSEYNDSQVEYETSDYLPQTGTQTSHLLLLIGITLIAIGLIFTKTFLYKGGLEHGKN